MSDLLRWIVDAPIGEHDQQKLEAFTAHMRELIDREVQRVRLSWLAWRVRQRLAHESPTEARIRLRGGHVVDLPPPLEAPDARRSALPFAIVHVRSRSR